MKMYLVTLLDTFSWQWQTKKIEKATIQIEIIYIMYDFVNWDNWNFIFTTNIYCWHILANVDVVGNYALYSLRLFKTTPLSSATALSYSLTHSLTHSLLLSPEKTGFLSEPKHASLFIKHANSTAGKKCITWVMA